jgi:predicted nucleic acid-binding protein
MRKTRLYLEASPIIRVDDNNSPVKQAITKEFFRIVAENSDEYELFVSPVTFEEVFSTKATEEKRKATAAFLETIQYTELPGNSEAEALAKVYTIDGVLSRASNNDLRHVAYAVVSRCDYVITWNMGHLANEQTVRRVNIVNVAENYGRIFITTPEFLTGGKIYGQ